MSSSPRHSPPPSAAAPRPKGILKNSSADPQLADQRRPSAQPADAVDEHGNRLAWDETNLTLHEIERENQAARMKIDEPKTPFVRSASLGPMDEDSMGFNLDGQQQQPPNYFPPTNASASGASTGEPSASGSGPSSRRSSAAEQLAANTIANAGRRPSAGSIGSSGHASADGGAAVAPAVGLDSVDVAAAVPSALKSGSRRADSRSPSFTLPPGGSRRSSSAANIGDRSREGVRQEMKDRDDAMQGIEGEAALDDDDENLDPEAKAKQDEFNRKRNAHYGNEAEAMKIAAALAAQEDDEDDEDDEEEARSIPPVPPLPNGST